VQAADVLPMAEAIIFHDIFKRLCENNEYTKILQTSTFISRGPILNMLHVTSEIR
jgi:hypothetical protein